MSTTEVTEHYALASDHNPCEWQRATRDNTLSHLGLLHPQQALTHHFRVTVHSEVGSVPTPSWTRSVTINTAQLLSITFYFVGLLFNLLLLPTSRNTCMAPPTPRPSYNPSAASVPLCQSLASRSSRLLCWQPLSFSKSSCKASFSFTVVKGGSHHHRMMITCLITSHLTNSPPPFSSSQGCLHSWKPFISS